MNINKETLIKYGELKNIIENKAVEALKEYYKFNDWKFPSDFSLEGVSIENDQVYVNYFGYDTADTDCFPIDYFLTLDSTYLA